MNSLSLTREGHPAFYFYSPQGFRGFPDSSVDKESACSAGDAGSIPDPGRFPWKRKWQPTPVFLPEKSHEQRSLVGYSPWGHKRVGHDLANEQQQMGVLKHQLQQ